MANNGSGLNIPEWKALDFSALGELPQIYQAAKKASAEQARSKWDIERQHKEEERKQAEFTHQQTMDTRALDIANSQQLLPGSDTFRAAAMSTALGNQVGKPYGISFEDVNQHDPVADTATPSSAEAAKFLQSGGVPRATGNPAKPDANAELLDYKAPKMAPETSPDVAPEHPPAAAPIDADTLAASNEAQLPTTRHQYANFRGSRFEPPKEGGTSVFPEPEYNAMVGKLVATGRFDDASAIKQVEAIRKADIGEQGKDKRFGASLGQKENTQLTREERMQMQQDALATSRGNSQGRDRAIVESAGIHAGAGGPIGDPKIINAYNSYSKAAQASALMKQDQQGQRMFDRIAAELDPANPNALNHQMANHSMAAISISTGGGAGRVPVSVIHDVRNAYSMALSAKNWIYKQAHGGENMPEVNAVMQQASDKLRALSLSERMNDFQVWDHKAGHASPWANDPKTRPLVDAEAESVRAQLHLPPLADSPPETPYMPAPQEPSPQAARPHAAPKAPAHPSGDPVGTIKDIGGGRKVRKVGPNNWQPVTQ